MQCMNRNVNFINTITNIYVVLLASDQLNVKKTTRNNT